jgi:hypothetical protein
MDWKPTLELRYFRKKFITGYVFRLDRETGEEHKHAQFDYGPAFLQQKWVSHLGTEEWRTVSWVTVEEEVLPLQNWRL